MKKASLTDVLDEDAREARKDQLNGHF